MAVDRLSARHRVDGSGEGSHHCRGAAHHYVVAAAILCWYVVFGLLLVPYRVARRHGRKRRIEAMRHTETLSAFYRPDPGNEKS